MKKTLLLSLALFIFKVNSAQQLPLFSDNEENSNKTTKEMTFKSLVEKGETYFSTKDINQKGSGYKPFKRWEYHWSRYLDSDGKIAKPQHLWNAWEQKKELEKSSKITSNWSALGPFDQTSKSGQGRINTVAVHPLNNNIIYAGAPAGGLWKSTDAGVNWTPLTDNLPQIGVSGIAIDKNDTNIIYISTGDDDAGDSFSIGVLKSLDAGQTWQTTGNILGNPTLSNEIFIDPDNSQRVWVATSNGLFLSTNAGTSWDRKLTGNIKDFKLKPTDPNTIYAVSNNRFYRSTNGGSSFSTIINGLPAFSAVGAMRVEVTPASNNNVYVLAGKPRNQNYAFQGLYVSTDNGASFTKTAENNNIFQSSQAWYDLAFSVSPTDANTMFVGVLNIWKSSNGGNNFTRINDWTTVDSRFTHADIHFLRFFNGVLYAGTDGGIYKSTNAGVSFTDLTKNMAISQFYKVSVSKQTSGKMAGGLQDNGGFSLINNTWNNYHGGDGMDAASDPNDENTFYGFIQFGGALSKTSNGGANGSFIASAPADETNPSTNDSGGNWVTPLVATKGSDLYAGYSQIYKLNNNNWERVSDHGFGGDLEALEIDPSNNDNMYASRGMIFHISNDRGNTFATRAPSQTGLSGVNISSIEVHNSDSNIIWVTTTGVSNLFGPSSGHTGGGVFKSVNGGITFSNITDNLPNESKFVVRHHPFSSDNSIYVGTALGVYHRNDNTNTWEVFSTNLPNVAVTDLEINPYDNTITAATYGRSVWQSPLPTVSLPQDDADLLKLIAPNVSCGTLNPKLLIANNGQNTVTSLSINYNIDGGTNQTFNWSGSLASNETTEINLPMISSNTEGDHVINAEIVLVNDSNSNNNKNISAFITNQLGEGQYINTFGDENDDTWITSNDLWEIGKPTTTDFNGKIETGYATNLDGNYSDGTTAYLVSPCYNLASLVNPVLKFKMAFDIENEWDVLYMEYSTDSGQSWEILGTASDPNWYNSSFISPNRPITVGKQWTGKDTTLKEYSYDLVDLNNEPSVIFRFVFATDAAVNEEGAIIDDFQIDATQVLSVDELEASSFNIYPNPSKDIFKISRTDYLGASMEVKVFDVTGKLIKHAKNVTSNNYNLDLSNASKGMYFLKVDVENKFLTKKIILN